MVPLFKSTPTYREYAPCDGRPGRGQTFDLPETP